MDKPSIVLVHGAFADGSCWQHLIPLLEREGHYVIAVQNALNTLAGDIATTRRVIDAQPGPCVVVGHSYGGAVITGAAAGAANVKGLVYVAAFAPDAGEPVGAFFEKYPSDLSAALRPDAAGFVYIDRDLFRSVFAADVAEQEARVMAATQQPANGAIFAAILETPAWKTIPSWYLVARNDHAVNPDLQRFFAQRMAAQTTELESSHVPFIARPGDVAKLIEQAALEAGSAALV